MSLSISQYSQWAAVNANNEAAISKGTPSLERASNQVGTLARFFNTSSAKAVRSAVMTDFSRALRSQFGASLAQQVLSDAGLTPTSKLDGKTIAAVIKNAQELHKAEVDSLASQDLRLAKGTITLDDIQRFGDDQIKGYLGLRRLAIDALGEMPLDAGSLREFSDRVDSIKQQLLSLTNRVTVAPRPGTFATIYNDAIALEKALDDKLDEMEHLLAGKPLSDAGKQEFQAVWRDAAKITLQRLKTIQQPSASMQQAYETLLDTVSQKLDGPNPQITIPVMKDVKKDLAASLLAALKQELGGKDFGMSKDDLAKLIFSSYRMALNQRPWPTIEKSLTAVVSNTPLTLKSKIVPGAQIGAGPQDAKGPIGQGYEPGVNGYMCHCADKSHATNLAVSSITIDGNPPQTAFQGIRHGVHCAWELNDPTARRAANVQRAQESVIAAFLADPANAQKIQNGEIHLNMTSVSLLTPDFARHIQGKTISDERQMLSEQTAAWEQVARDGVQFQHNGQIITIRPTILTFNFGVNSGAVNFGSVAPRLVGGWGRSDEMNGRAFAALKTRAENFANSNAPQALKAAVKELLKQCEEVLAAKGERKDSHDAYKMAARIAVLSYLMGDTPCWNCKSGKDRTGEMDVECKFLATLIARGEPIPRPGVPLTKEQKELFRTIALEGGNFEVQKLNTGFAGFKTSGVSSIPERLGGQEYRDFHKGGADYVSV